MGIASLLTSTIGIEERFEAAIAHALQPGFQGRIAAHTHAGAGPCRRWVEAEKIPNAELDAAAAALETSGSLKDPTLAIALTHRWSTEAEGPLHREDADHELEQEVLEGLNEIDRFWIRTLGKRHLLALSVTSSAAESGALRLAAQAEAALDARALRAIWEAHPLATSDAGWGRMLDRVKPSP